MAQGLFTLRQVNQAIRQGAWSAFNPPQWVEYLCVAGGGSGSYSAATQTASGGGAGGLLTGIVPVAAGASYTVTVGGGGAAQTGGGASGNNGVTSVFGSITATGGGGGGAYGNSGASGGSGGGSSRPADGAKFGQGVIGQGNNGGVAGDNNGAGGGGAGTVGLNVSGSANGSVGGAGIASAISGTVIVYAGGGGGGSSNSGTYFAPGGVGGGGNGGSYASTSAGAGSGNTGGGGGGGPSMNSGAGGSGIVIVSYPDTYAAATSTTGSPTVSTSGSGSLSFPGGSNVNVYTNATSAVNVGSGNFTSEGWFYSASAGTAQNVFRGYNVFGNGILVSSSTLIFYLSSTGSSWDIASGVGTGSVSSNTWYHFALVRNGTNITIYLNGVASGSVTTSAALTAMGGINVGAENNGVGSNVFNGYLTNFRHVVGTAVYTSAFTPPTAPLTAISGTQFLMPMNSGARYAETSSNSFIMNTVGSTPWNAASPFTVTGYKNRVYTFTSSGSITI